MNRSGRAFGAALGFVTLACSAAAQPAGLSHRVSTQTWRQEREAALKADGGWLTVAGLFFLKEGPNRFGTDPLADIVLPPGSAPPDAGVFDLREGKTTVRIPADVPATINGKVVREMELRSDAAPGGPDLIALGDVTLSVHASGARQAIRLRDKNSAIRREFTGCRWFPIDETYRVEGRLIPYDTPKKVRILNILGDIEEYTSPGQVAFSLKGQPVLLEPVTSARNRLWFIFRDLTSGKETYGAARFLYADAPGPDGKVILDFNRAYNPPCAFNPYTTCPLPTEQNRLR
ncbi:MAG: DUF1684 domain-containing protein, partial [Acidobacteria bacterium]|nr:DUF1684 domain-containing protein [Acidobacteriota bacterium]